MLIALPPPKALCSLGRVASCALSTRRRVPHLPHSRTAAAPPSCRKPASAFAARRHTPSPATRGPSHQLGGAKPRERRRRGEEGGPIRRAPRHGAAAHVIPSSPPAVSALRDAAAPSQVRRIPAGLSPNERGRRGALAYPPREGGLLQAPARAPPRSPPRSAGGVARRGAIADVLERRRRARAGGPGGGGEEARAVEGRRRFTLPLSSVGWHL